MGSGGGEYERSEELSDEDPGVDDVVKDAEESLSSVVLEPSLLLRLDYKRTSVNSSD